MTAERLPVLFLWHHHQPFYHAPQTAWPLMPWVRLHAARGYRDMAAAMQAAPVRMTFNFTPVLLEQLEFAEAHEPADEFERLSRIPAGDLTEEERRFILRNFFSINWAVHIRPHPRYRRLLAKRGETVSEASLRQALRRLHGSGLYGSGGAVQSRVDRFRGPPRSCHRRTAAQDRALHARGYRADSGRSPSRAGRSAAALSRPAGARPGGTCGLAVRASDSAAALRHAQRGRGHSAAAASASRVPASGRC